MILPDVITPRLAFLAISEESHAERVGKAKANDLEPTVPASQVSTPPALPSGAKNSTDD